MQATRTTPDAAPLRPGRLAALRSRLLTAVSGDPDGAPAWVLALAEGDDEGYFVEDGPAWTVHEGTATFVAGIRALLLQALHPGPMAGVHDWSRYREDPLGRLSGTVRWILCLTYGSKTQADAETARVGRFHARVNGSYVDGAGAERAYSAADPDLADWVHLAFTDAFLTCHETWGRPIPGGADAYVAEWALAGRLMRVQDPPTSRAELHARMDGYLERGELRGDERARDVVRFLRKPPFAGRMGFAYRMLFASAVATIPRRYRRLLGVRRTPLPVITATRVVLAVAERALTSGGPRANDRARERLRRLEREGRAAPDPGEPGARPASA
ncbi:oxygenase MpaB family protein [Microbacterium sp. SS28]|uniref:oxygenase MpaB family protein n=1 Tax=Microbacterium sp. SS28 TaxID=2919948 RepID=UPI001FAB1137|nr:oxygenase MpaB family protein [Microbacterium sp. SS28]